MRHPRTAFAGLILLGSLGAAPEMAEIRPAESGPIHNPLKGFRPDGGNKVYSPLWRKYVRWSDIEKCEADSPSRLTSYLNDIAASAPASNIKLVPRVYLDWDGTLDAKGNPRQYWPGDLHRFDYQSPEFIARLKRLIGRMGAAWDTDPRIAYVQMGLIGWWGEMHHPTPTPAMMELLIAEFKKAFTHKQVLVRTVDDPFMKAGFGNYYDTFATFDREPEHLTKEPGPQEVPWALLHKYPEQWKIAPMEGEVEYNWQKQQPKARPLETFGKWPDETMTNAAYRRYMAGKFRKYHVSYMGWISGFTDTNAAVVEGAGALNEVMGYRFVLTSFAWTPDPKGNLKVRFTVRNDGSAPFYQKWPVVLGLLDPVTREVKWQGDLKADLRTWMPGEGWDEASDKWNTAPKEWESAESASVPSNLKPGDYVVALAILDPDGGRLPSVRFATKNYWKGGWHPMGHVGIGGAPAKTNVTGPFDDLIRDESLHYIVPASFLSVKEPPVPAFKPVPLFKPDAGVELVNPKAYWALEKRGKNTGYDHTGDGPDGALALHVTGDFGPDTCLNYASEYLDKWPGGEYVLRFLMKSTAGAHASFHVADFWKAVTEEFPLPPSPEWKPVELKFKLPDTWTKFPRLRFMLQSQGDERFSISGVHLRLAQPSASPSNPGESPRSPTSLDKELKALGKLGASRIPATHPKFSEAWNLSVAEKPKQAWEAGMRATMADPLAAGDVLFLSFYARAVGTAPGILQLDYQKNSAPWTSSFGASVKVPFEWTAFAFAFPAKVAYAAGDAKLSFLLGAQAQNLELARVFLTNEGKGKDVEALIRGGPR